MSTRAYDARNLLMKTLPSDEAKRIMATIEHSIHQQPFSFCRKREGNQSRPSEEHPQTIALCYFIAARILAR